MSRRRLSGPAVFILNTISIVILLYISLYLLKKTGVFKQQLEQAPRDDVCPSRCLNDDLAVESTIVDATTTSYSAVEPKPTLKPWDSSYYVRGTPGTNFRDNLLRDKSYLTAWCLGGFTNLFMGQTNLIYLGLISDRIPVLPPFSPSHHISDDAGVIAFGDVFNLTHLRDVLQFPVIEWSDIKTPLKKLGDPSASWEGLGCWSVRSRDVDDASPDYNFARALALDASYTRVPDQMYRSSDFDEGHTNFWNLASLIYPVQPAFGDQTFPLLKVSPKGEKRPPDRHLACFDTLYYVGTGADSFEWTRPWSPAWRTVGKHLRFTDHMQKLGKEYAARVFDVAPNQLPPFIAVHVRHGDFKGNCWATEVIKECYADLAAFVRRVEEVQEELREKLGLDVIHIIISTDEKDEDFWEEVDYLGWGYVDHEQEGTVKTYGEWYGPIIDIVIHSLAVGFVGTDGSTLSLVSGKRVEDWNNGVTRTVKWGYAGADNH
ncbi:uncharacterized protein BT62DRAFT_932112 [Guyanagaster necrorhizus]|uniref:GDP-fucose protein O-fucosyltransferase n=1 Tax=Guyanagaster necrorhizus TaxID=856835 RepID=A0A9P7VSL2_9AGAR|nr:uncharacterized protein BT62DRAFT_932112 [Guyanagaster necrorhizus MCA 3950]KAG7446668.1 hypothetical protein BT62DRAFT_932112 [Guyanagaster necrorhizus MCA 3950]